jgi:hypothetical protein
MEACCMEESSDPSALRFSNTVRKSSLINAQLSDAAVRQWHGRTQIWPLVSIAAPRTGTDSFADPSRPRSDGEHIERLRHRGSSQRGTRAKSGRRQTQMEGSAGTPSPARRRQGPSPFPLPAKPGRGGEDAPQNLLRSARRPLKAWAHARWRIPVRVRLGERGQ